MKKVNRRKFLRLSASTAAYLAIQKKGVLAMSQTQKNKIRLGGPVFMDDIEDPVQWVKEHRTWGYSAGYCPLDADASDEMVNSLKNTARKSNLIIAEVGAWSNPISPDEKQRREAFAHCCAQLDLADRLAARCCVNIAGSRHPDQWDAPHPENLTQDTFDLIVEITQKIIDFVKPKNTFFTIETMPWIHPNSVESYERLIKAINRDRFAVHFDPVNLINSPDKYYNNAQIIKEAFKKLGPYIKSCHGKDTIIEQNLTTHISEIDPGKGNLDYAVYLNELSKLKDIPLILEHMEEPEQYRNAIAYVKQVGLEEGLEFVEI